jgi:hypothetical protein
LTEIGDRITIQWKGRAVGGFTVSSPAMAFGFGVSVVTGEWEPADGPDAEAFLKVFEQAQQNLAETGGSVELDPLDEHTQAWLKRAPDGGVWLVLKPVDEGEGPGPA